MAGYYRNELPTVPNFRNMDYGATEVIKAGDMLARTLDRVREGELADAQRAQEKAKYQDLLTQRALDNEFKNKEFTANSDFRNKQLAQQAANNAAELKLRQDELNWRRSEANQARAEKKRDLAEAMKLLNVSSTVDTVSDNSLDVNNANRRNQALANKQETYGRAFSDAASLMPQREGQSNEDYFRTLDAEAKKAAGIAPDTDISGFALGDVPKLETKTVSRPKTQDEYAKDIYGRLSSIAPSESAIKVGQGLIESYAKNGELLKTLKEEKATVADLKNVYSAMGGDATKVDTKKGLEAGIKAREAVLKAEFKKTADKNKDSAYSGLIKTMDEESIDNYRFGVGKTDQGKILDVVKQYKVPEKDAIAILNNVDRTGKFSSSVANSFEDFVKANYSK